MLKDRILSKAMFEFNKHTWRNQQRMFISAIDLMQPVNGIITAAQLTIVSRMLDIELVRKGEDSSWDARLQEIQRTVSAEECHAFCLQTRDIVESLDKYGWDYNLSSISVNRKPFFAYNGTHRMAYSLLKNPYQMIPITIDNDGWEWSSKDGVDYFREKGLSESEIQILVNRYYALINEYKYYYVLIVSENDSKRIHHEISSSSNIMIESVKKYRLVNGTEQSWWTKQDRSFVKGNLEKVIVAIHFDMLEKDIFCHKGVFGSKKIEQWLKTIGIKSYMYSPTITRAIELDIWLNKIKL